MEDDPVYDDDGEYIPPEGAADGDPIEDPVE
jgi:hypothetical protein